MSMQAMPVGGGAISPTACPKGKGPGEGGSAGELMDPGFASLLAALVQGQQAPGLMSLTGGAPSASGGQANLPSGQTGQSAAVPTAPGLPLQAALGQLTQQVVSGSIAVPGTALGPNAAAGSKPGAISAGLVQVSVGEQATTGVAISTPGAEAVLPASGVALAGPQLGGLAAENPASQLIDLQVDGPPIGQVGQALPAGEQALAAIRQPGNSAGSGTPGGQQNNPGFVPTATQSTVPEAQTADQSEPIPSFTVAPQVGSTGESQAPTQADSAQASGLDALREQRQDPDQLMATISRAVRSSRDGEYSVTLKLHPESLGEVRLQLQLSGRQVHTMMEVANPEARQALESKGEQLRQSLDQAGFTLSGFEVSTGQDRESARSRREAIAEQFQEQAQNAGQRTQTGVLRPASAVESIRSAGRRTGRLDTMA